MRFLPPQAGAKAGDLKSGAYQSKPRNALQSAFEDAVPNAPKDPVDKADLPDIASAQAMIPYLGDIHRHYRESEARHTPAP